MRYYCDIKLPVMKVAVLSRGDDGGRSWWLRSYGNNGDGHSTILEQWPG